MRPRPAWPQPVMLSGWRAAVLGLVLLMPLITAPVAAQPGCYTSSIQAPVPFLGNHGEIARLADGSLWEVQHEYRYLYAYYPQIIACPQLGALIVNDQRLAARLVGSPPAPARGGRPARPGTPANTVIESQIDGTFQGWSGETIFRLTNGQIWQQASYAYYYHYAFRPQVMILPFDGGYQMQVEGVTERLPVRPLR